MIIKLETKKANKRLTIDFPTKLFADLESIKKEMDAPSLGASVRNGCQILILLWELHRQGHEFAIKKDGRYEEIDIFEDIPV